MTKPIPRNAEPISKAAMDASPLIEFGVSSLLQLQLETA
jgi:hypothetical protein